MSKLDQQEILALVSWLQTFDHFPYSVVDGGLDGDDESERFNIALDSLENIKISRAIVSIAEEVCDTENIDVGEDPCANEIWRILLHVTTARSRFDMPLPTLTRSNHEIPHVVMANLLDFAVTSPNLDDRRKYIERIMSLSKSVQKILMNLIEHRKKTLPRKPKGQTPRKTVRSMPSPRKTASPQGNTLCGDSQTGNDDNDGMDSEIVAIRKTILNNCAAAVVPRDSAYDDECSENTPMEPPEKRTQAYSTPTRKQRTIVPQSEPRNAGRGDTSFYVFTPTNSQRGYGRHFSGNSTTASQESEEEMRAPKPRQPEGYYMSLRDKKMNPKAHSGFFSPSKGQHEKQQKKYASPNKRHSTGNSNTLPFREKQVQSTRAAFVSIHNQNSKSQNSLKKDGLDIPPPPPPPCPPKMHNDQELPVYTTASDDFDISKHFPIPMMQATLSTVTEGSTGISTDVLLNKHLSAEPLKTPSRTQYATTTDSPRPKTPESALATYERDVDGQMMLSPAESMLQSPMQVDEFVKELRAKNKNLESILKSYQKRERELSQKMESTENKLRKEMMKLESRALGREDELRRSYDEEMTRLKKELREEQEKNRESKKAQEQLANANDELDLMQHTHEKLLEATEKIRKYKERLDNMNDFKEALEREQEAHNKSVDECVRLQNELSTLQPLKRQLEDYKKRALETEVQLAETKDALARLQRERDALNGAREDVMKQADAHRAQADELRKFIRLEEQEGDPHGIGEGISELNPELQEELIKLRNENAHLREFEAARTDDGVRRLQESLEDSNMRQERFKQEYLRTKNNLESTESLLSEAKQKLEHLEAEIEQKDFKAAEYENRLHILEDHYTACLEDLEGLQEEIEKIEEEKSALEVDLAEWKQMAEKLEEELKRKNNDLSATQNQLSETEKIKMQVESDLAEWKQIADKLQTDLSRSSNELEEERQSLKKAEALKTEVEGELAEWKMISEKFEAELGQKNEELKTNKETLELLQNDKADLENELEKWKLMSEQLEIESKSRAAELDETKHHLTETEELLGEAESAQDELLRRIDIYEKKLIEVEDEQESTQKELERTQRSLDNAQSALKEAEERETKVNEECAEIKEVSEQLVRQLREEKKSKKSIIEESHRSLEATREVLNSKSKKDLEELQANMNQLLNDERKAYRLKAEKASADYKKLEEKYKSKLQEVQKESAASLKTAKEESQKCRKEVEDQMRKEMENVKKQEEEKRKNLIATGENMIEDAKTQATEQITEMHEKNVELKRLLAEKDDEGEKLGNKNASLKKKLEYATQQITNLESNQDELQEEVKKIEREKVKLEEENDRYRRQLGGRYGADGQMQGQVESLTKELNDVHEKNRELRRQLAMRPSDDLSTSFSHDECNNGYSRGGFNSTALSQLRRGFEQQIEELKDEMRQLVMKNSAALADVQKAEQRAWHREEECLGYKKELTSLKLKLQRQELSGNNENSFYNQGNETSFYSASVRDTSFGSARDASFAGADVSHIRENRSQRHLEVNTTMNSQSQSILQLEENTRVLTPSKKHENVPKSFSDNSTTSMNQFGSPNKPNPYELHLQEVYSKKAEGINGHQHAERSDSFVNFTQTATSPTASDTGPECHQS